MRFSRFSLGLPEICQDAGTVSLLPIIHDCYGTQYTEIPPGHKITRQETVADANTTGHVCKPVVDTHKNKCQVTLRTLY